MKQIVNNERSKGVTFAKKILKRIIDETGVDIRTEGRTNEEAFIRTVFFKVCEDLTFLTLTDIGRLVNRKHSTVLHSRKIFEGLEKKYIDLYYCLVLDLTNHKWKAREYNEIKQKNKELEKTLSNIKAILDKPMVSIIDLRREINK